MSGGWAALGAGLLACLPLLVLNLLPGGEPALLLYVAPASAFSMWALLAAWRRLPRHPTTRAGWSGVFLAASLLGAALTGALAGALVVLAGLLGPTPVRLGELLPLLPRAVGASALSGLAFGFLTLSAPLGGLLFVWLARKQRHDPAGPAARARYTPPHD